MAFSLLFAPIFLVLPAPIKAMIVVVSGFLFFSVEQQVEQIEQLEVLPVVEAPADAE